MEKQTVVSPGLETLLSLFLSSFFSVLYGEHTVLLKEQESQLQILSFDYGLLASLLQTSWLWIFPILTK